MEPLEQRGSSQALGHPEGFGFFPRECRSGFQPDVPRAVMCCHTGNNPSAGPARLRPWGQGILQSPRCQERGRVGCWSCSQLEDTGWKANCHSRGTPTSLPHGCCANTTVRPGSSSFPPGPGPFLLFLTDSSSFHKKEHSLVPAAIGSARNDPGHNAHFLPQVGLRQPNPGTGPSTEVQGQTSLLASPLHRGSLKKQL